MPSLGDYIGQLLSEISIARMQADLESVRIAEIYASHPLLRSMPVPHMRLPSVDLDIPLIVEGTEGPREGETARGGFSLARLRERFDEVLDSQFASEEIALSAPNRRRLSAALDDAIDEEGVPPEVSIDVYGIADALTQTALTYMDELKPSRIRPIIQPEFAAKLKAAVRRAFVSERSSPPRLSVLVTTAEIREAGGAEVLTRLTLRVSEEGLEWTTIESAAGEYDKLVPE